MNVILLIWGQLSFILGVGGNVFVLYATIFHNAIKLDKMSIWIIKNLAFTDLCNCIFILLPTISNQYSEGTWIFGLGLCYAYAVNQYTFMVANMVLINLLSMNKLLRCIHPLRNMNPSRLHQIFVPASTFVICSIPIIWSTYTIIEDLSYIPYFQEDGTTKLSENICSAITRKGQSSIINAISVLVPVLCNATPCLTLTISTTILLVYSIRKTNRPVNKKNVFVVISVTVTFLISYLPLCVVALVAHSNFSWTIQDGAGAYRYTWALTFLSSWCNPLIYLIMNQRFREFSRFKQKACVRKLFPISRNNERNPRSLHLSAL